MKIITKRSGRARDFRGVTVEQSRYGSAPLEANLSRVAGTRLASDVVFQAADTANEETNL